MRILLVNQYFPPDSSASAQLVGELAEDLARHHRVVVLAGRPSYNPGAMAPDPPGTRVVRAWSTTFHRVSMLGRVANYASFLASSLVRAMFLPRPDVVVALTDPPAIGLVGLLASRRYRVPFVYVCQDIFPDVAVALGMLRNPAVVGMWRRLNRRLQSGSARVVVIGRDMRAKLEREGVPPERITLIRNWGNGQALPAVERRRIRRHLGWEGRTVVMHAGNLGLAQNPGVLVKAAALLRDTDVQVVFLGDGAARPEVEALVGRLGCENVSFLPYRPTDEAQQLMGAADLHVVSLHPGLLGCVAPTKVYGILAAGRPFVAAVQPGSEPGLLVEEIGCGARVDPDDPAALAGAIRRLADGSLDEMGSRARRAFNERFNRTSSTGQYRDLLESLERGRSKG